MGTAQLQMAIACDRAELTEDGLQIFGLADVAYLEPSGRSVSFHLLVRLIGDPGRYGVRFVARRSDGQTRDGQSGQVEIVEGGVGGTAGFPIQVGDVVAGERLEFDVYVDGELRFTVPVLVVVRPQPTAIH